MEHDEQVDRCETGEEPVDDPWSRALERALHAEDPVSLHMRELQESGALKHLHGKPLDLDNDPEWLITRTLKQAGFSHPLIEQRRDVYLPLSPIETKLNRLRERRAWLASPDSRSSTAERLAFNEDRSALLDAYRAVLTEVNSAILSFNLQAPRALHERQLRVDDLVTEAERDTAPLELISTDDAVPARLPGRFERLSARIRGRDG
jgi:hypothetical protein